LEWCASQNPKRLFQECEKLLPKTVKNYGTLTEEILGALERKAKRGRPTIDDGWLSGNRDALLNMFAFGWPEIGSQLAAVTNRDELRTALQPLENHNRRQYINRLLRQTTAKGNGRDIRKKRRSLGKAVTQMHNAQSRCSDCMNRCREIETALIQATDDQFQILFPELSKRRIECQAAQDQSRFANETQISAENEVIDEEAAYAQDQLLIFIGKRKYAFHPLNLANAIAGLPFAIGIPFMGVWQSHARCSKVKAPGWPHYGYKVFKIIESAWKHASSSSQPVSEVLERKIRTLPKMVIYEHSQMRPRKVENYVRTFLCRNWWYLLQAIKKSLETADDPRPPYFLIASNLEKFIAEPKTSADLAIAETMKLRD
jgi:hypothetical protein